jgi:hypothetical protein
MSKNSKGCNSGLDRRYRDKNGEIRRKRGDTKVETLRQEYGQDFAQDFRSDMHLETLLSQTGVSSLSQYLKENR